MRAWYSIIISWGWVAIVSGVSLMVMLLGLLSGCGGINISTTNYYTVTGDSNKLTQTIRTDSRPDITAPTNMTATVPVSALP